MFGKLLSLSGALATLFLAGCSVTPTMYPPVDRNAAVSPERFLGAWSCVTGSDRYEITVMPNKIKGNSVRIQIVQIPDKKQENFHGTWAPLGGMFLKIGEKYFLAATVDAERLLLEAERNVSALWMLKPVYYLMQLTENAYGYELRFISFAAQPESGSGAAHLNKRNAWIPVDPKVKLSSDSLVLNSTAEIQEFLKNGKYLPDKNVYPLVRKQTAAQQRK